MTSEVFMKLCNALPMPPASEALINFDKGKIELIWNVLGKAAKATKLALHSDGNKLKCFMGFCSTISTGPFSIATLNIQRVDS